jgi:hypothetical protein
MNILIIDIRSGTSLPGPHGEAPAGSRASFLQQSKALKGHSLKWLPHVCGEHTNQDLDDEYDEWGEALQQEVHQQILPFEIILLHVGDLQIGAEKALKHLYQDKHVVCFSGSGIPPSCLEHCQKQGFHAFIRESIPLADTWPQWSLEQLCVAFELLETGQWRRAKDFLEMHNTKLEEALILLYAHLNEKMPVVQLAKLRDEELIKAQEQISGIRN